VDEGLLARNTISVTTF